MSDPSASGISNVKIKIEPNTEPTKQQTTAESQNTTQKRVFVPNLAVKREKKDVVPEVDQAASKPRRQFQPNISERGRGRGSRQSNVIVTPSVFEAGPAESTKRFGGRDAYASSSNDIVIGSASSMGSASNDPSINKKHKKEANPFEDLLLEPSTDTKGSFVQLPNIDTKSSIKNLKKPDQLDPITKLFSHENESSEELLFLQMVDCLQLSDLEEGQIGKIRVYKSGKTELCLNNSDLKFNLSLATDAAFLQDLVSVNANENSDDTGEMTCVGHVKHKLLFTPKF